MSPPIIYPKYYKNMLRLCSQNKPILTKKVHRVLYFKNAIHILIADFFCQNDSHCYNKGLCNNGTCTCQPGWNEELDCTSMYL